MNEKQRLAHLRESLHRWIDGWPYSLLVIDGIGKRTMTQRLQAFNETGWWI